MPVVVVIPGPDPPPDPLGSGSTPLFLRSSDMAHLPISPYLCTDRYARLIRMFHGHSVILPTCAAKTRDSEGGGDRKPEGRLRGAGGEASRPLRFHSPFFIPPACKVGTCIVTYTTITEDTPQMEAGYGGTTLYMRAGN